MNNKEIMSVSILTPQKWQGFISLPILEVKNLTTQRKSESAKEAWKKYRINYKMGNIREQIRNYLGIKPLGDTNTSFNYHRDIESE